MNDLPSISSNDLPPETYRAAQAGDLRAIEAVIRHHQRPVRSWLAAHCPVGGDADDVAQRTFVAAISRLADYRCGTSFAAWLFAIARFQLMSEATRLRRLADYHARFAPDLLARELERRAEEPPEPMATRLHHLRACLAEAGEAARRFLQWRYEDGLPLQEIAARSGRSVAAVKKQLWLLRQKLQQCIDAKMAVETWSTP